MFVKNRSVFTRVLLKASVAGAAIAAWPICEAQVVVTSTFDGMHDHQETLSGCVLADPANWVSSGNGLTLDSDFNCDGGKNTGSIHVAITISPTTIKGAPAYLYNDPKNYYLVSTLTADVTASYTVSGASVAFPGIDIGFNSLTNNNSELAQCQALVVSMMSAHATCTLGTAVGGGSLYRDPSTSPPTDYLTVNMSFYFNNGNPRSIGYTVSPQFSEASSTDSISLTTVSPDPARPLMGGSTQTFQGTVQTTLNSADTAKVFLQLLDRSGTVLYGIPADVNRGTSNTQITIPNAQLPASGPLTLRALLAPSGVSTQITSAPVTYTIAAATDLMITAIHIVQAIQSPKEDVTIIAGKQTVARVFVKAVGPGATAVAGVTAHLRCSIANDLQNYGANPSTGPITALPIAGPPDPTTPPDLTEASLDFIIPSKCSGVQNAASVTAEIVLPPGVTDPNLSNNTFTRSVGFVAPPVNPFRIAYVRIPYQPPGQAAPTFADRAFVARGANSLRLMFPVSQVNYFPLTIDYQPYTSPVISHDDWATLLRSFTHTMELNEPLPDDPEAYDQVAGWVPYIAGTQAGGIAGTRDFGLSGTTFLALDNHDDAYDQRQVFAHEIGHNMGLRHVITAADQAAGCAKPGGDPATSGWPWHDGTIQTAGYFIPTMRPLPKTDYDLMTYCPSNTLWISPYAAETIYQNGMTPPIGPARQIVFGDLPPKIRNGTKLSATAEDLWLVSGSIHSDNSSAQLDSVLKVTTTRPPTASDPNGKYCLNFTGTGSQFCFTIPFVDSEGNTLTEQPFTYLIAAVPNATGATLTANGQTLTSIAAQPNLSVTITSPQPGDNWQGSSQTIQWTSNASEQPRFAVQYSHDNGASWQALASDLTATQLTIDASKLQGGNQVLFRVLAGSGVSTASATVGPITISQAPQIQIAATLDLHTAVSTQSADRTFPITNTGTGPLRITAITSSDAQFQVVGPLTPAIVMAGESEDLVIRFNPQSSAPVNASLRIESNDATQPVVTVALTGRGVDSAAPEMAVDQTSIDFGTTLQGQSSTRSVTVTNFGATDLSVQSIAIIGPFVLGQNPAPLTLQPGQNVVLNIRFVPQISGAASGTLTVGGSDAAHASIVVNLTGTGAPSGNVTLPQLRATNPVVNGATFAPGLARGALGTVFGTNLASSSPLQQTSTPWATTLGAVKVIIAGIPAPLYYVSATQINFQVPYETAPGTVSLVVSRDGYESAPAQVNIVDYAPGVFQYARTATSIDPIVVHSATNQLVSPTSPVTAQEYLVAYLTGFGKLSNPPPTGNGASGFLLSSSLDAVTATFGGSPATVLFAGLTPGFVGLVQINVQVGALPSGSCAALVFQVAGVSSPSANLATGAAGCAPATPASAPALSLSTTTLAFGTVNTGSTADQTLSVQNTGTATLNVTSLTISGAGFLVVSPSAPFSVAPGGSQTVTVRFAPTSASPATGTLTIRSNDATQPSASVSLSGTGSGGGGGGGTVILSDSFNRADATSCSLGQADLALGGSGTHYYLPVFSVSGASIISGALQNNGLDFGGVQLTASPGACGNTAFRGETLPQDLNISVDLFVPKTGSNVTLAGPYFRSRAAAAGDGIIGGTSAGYWVELVSSGEVRVLGLNPLATIATTGAQAAFDSTMKHTLQMAAQGSTLQVTVDGRLMTFIQSGASVTAVTLPATSGSNNGTVGISFGSSDNRGLAGGERAGNLVVSSYSPLSH